MKIVENPESKLKTAIRDIPDFPQKGILFKDITPILADGNLFKLAIQTLADHNHRAGAEAVVGIDARGFIFASAVAHHLGLGMIPVRKKGKLPGRTESVAYDLEYGKGELEIHVDAVKPGEKVVIVDDLLATGGTALAASKLVEKLGGTVSGIVFLVELTFLKGRDKLKNYPVTSIIQF